MEDSRASRVVVTLTDLAFGGLIGWSVFALIALWPQVFDVRIVMFGGNYGPEAYKVIIWAMFSLLILRPRFKARYLLAFAFIYCLAEDVGNWTYILYHWAFFHQAFADNLWNPFPGFDPYLTYKYLIFNLVPVLMFPFVRKNLQFKWLAFIPFALLIVAWLSIGYPLITDYSTTPDKVPAVLYWFEVVWTGFYLFGWGVSFLFSDTV